MTGSRGDGRRHGAPGGFTLLELLIVMAIIAFLGALLTTAARRARQEAQRIQCLSNLRQMVLAAAAYEDDHGAFPPAYERDYSTGETKTWEWFLWEMGTQFQIQQCPSFHGAAMWDEDRYTGYNYNASYIGGRVFRRDGKMLYGSTPSACMADIRDPSQCALFGDGEYESGANKFMRSPEPGPLDTDAALTLAGTQGFRHGDRTNVGFADGHAESLKDRYVESGGSGEPAPGCGFISPDNRLYDLR
ncbi:MAG: prepilin-type N-terminal cleavage/methylation domain-containing protein [Lentisphaerae bacterium]|nr:prepilin-type N-terminal cleavage/methylation domain-containing protein [Lentisphaerota bacterium]